jgi:Uma2 family endonuclease
MKLIIDNYTVEVQGSLHDGMSNEEFLHFCEQNNELRIERDANKQIFIMSPVNSLGGNQNIAISAELYLWNKIENSGICFDSSAGFTLPDGAVFSPDASWMKIEKWNALPAEEKQKFAAVCPDFIIELKSKSDNTNDLKNKMQKWIENGAQLAWLIDTAQQKTFIYRADKSIETIEGFNNILSGEDLLKGFEFDLSILK